MAKVHTVRAGECLSSIAATHGIRRWQTIYEHPDNEDFRALRPNPNVIYRGDELTIPDLEIKSVELATSSSHRLRLSTATTCLRIRVFDGGQQRNLEAHYRLHIEGRGEALVGQLDDGLLETIIPADASAAELELLDDKRQSVGAYSLRIGALDPPDTPSGVQGRLLALGYDCGPIDGRWGRRSRAALRAFLRVARVADDDEPYGQAAVDALTKHTGQ